MKATIKHHEFDTTLQEAIWKILRRSTMKEWKENLRPVFKYSLLSPTWPRRGLAIQSSGLASSSLNLEGIWYWRWMIMGEDGDYSKEAKIGYLLDLRALQEGLTIGPRTLSRWVLVRRLSIRQRAQNTHLWQNLKKKIEKKNKPTPGTTKQPKD